MLIQVFLQEQMLLLILDILILTGHLVLPTLLNTKNLSLTVGIDGSFGGVMESVVVEKMWWGGKHPNSVQYRDAEYDQW